MCLSHQRWHLHGRDIDLQNHSSYGKAERWLSGRLWNRGISLHTGELQLSCRLLQTALRDAPDAAPHRRAVEFGVDVLSDVDDALLCAYPEAVALTGLLVDAEFLRFLLGPRYRVESQVEIMQAAVAGVLRSSGGRALQLLSGEIVRRSRRAVMIAYGARKNARVKTVRCGLEKALFASARTNRACLLRHLDTVRMPALEVQPGWGATRTRSLNNAVLRPDDLDELVARLMA
ncbi:hypothetical protein D8Y23_14005 [Microbacterium enclense]|uniref:Uncharacterized protein n=1 Tax=Microbacterium enclense TaxID=993073 RepID=A0A3S3L5F4_9MICO|nr:hypothetical protein D8Y23_14005 [Microbacterium enclense]